MLGVVCHHLLANRLGKRLGGAPVYAIVRSVLEGHNEVQPLASGRLAEAFHSERRQPVVQGTRGLYHGDKRHVRCRIEI